MPNINVLLANLNETLRSISGPGDLTSPQIQDAVKKANDLIEAIKLQARAAQLKELEDFLNSIQQSLTQLYQVAQTDDPNKSRNLAQPTDILRNITEAFSKNIPPLILKMQHSGPQSNIQKASMAASLCEEVFISCRDLNTYMPQMNTKEKVCAVLGTVLMFAGVGMLIAATVNPYTLPIIAAVAVITVGCYLAKKAVERHKNAQAQQINASLDKQLVQIDQISSAYGMEAKKREEIKFSAAQACSYQPPTIQAVEHKPNLMEKANNFFKNLLRSRT